jgi:hypothetical protein
LPGTNTTLLGKGVTYGCKKFYNIGHRWQHGSQLCFATFFCENHKIAKNSTTTKAKEKISTDTESLES